ncbi:hypothetical protein OG897_32350 [Streptomyces sp. NBC_00237]|uniref:hypothetical protein n=1 Tax=Streptomyces sp. NBC_00237 TaxID=2975687 RepID=UPI002256AE33|nr:hypothetical protein [Streptomyces sp. NBC_00237]MCX5206091.1 hypothetical protein [Streptomyces sp. NBC_00237]
MPHIGPGFDDPEYDNYDPAWKDQDTPFRRWLHEKLTAAGISYAHDMAAASAPANRYNGFSELEMDNIAMLADVTVDDVRTAHKADLAHWAREQQLRDHPDLAVLDADLDRIRHFS